MSDLVKYISGGLLIAAMLGALRSASSALNGNLEQAFTPGWIDFAVAYPTLTALVLVGGTILFGGSFIAAVENL
ncbi:hypothetical protein [Haloprofundus halophilus]|uniref:hypothetical protein n=1 Tax=Haloprofundus halophilus TaxID=2283527 RepID=UPI00130048CC|nr:hypothetical protein [Haloprofundus halophilus]